MEHVNQDENDFIGKKSPRRFPKSSRRLKIKKKGIKNSLYEAGIHGQQFSIIKHEFNILVWFLGFLTKPVIISWTKKLICQLQKDPLKLTIRSNRECHEIITVKWSVEIATQWSKYESLNGKISILPGEDRGTIEITDENLKSTTVEKTKKSELGGIFQMVLRLEGPN